MSSPGIGTGSLGQVNKYLKLGVGLKLDLDKIITSVVFEKIPLTFP
jgi:hypothetical protein